MLPWVRGETANIIHAVAVHEIYVAIATMIERLFVAQTRGRQCRCCMARSYSFFGLYAATNAEPVSRAAGEHVFVGGGAAAAGGATRRRRRLARHARLWPHPKVRRQLGGSAWTTCRQTDARPADHAIAWNPTCIAARHGWSRPTIRHEYKVAFRGSLHCRWLH